MSSPLYDALNPRGVISKKSFTPSSPGISDLKDKVVYVINIGKPYAEGLLGAVADLLAERFPDTKIVRVIKKQAYYDDEPDLWSEIKEWANAVIIGPKD